MHTIRRIVLLFFTLLPLQVVIPQSLFESYSEGAAGTSWSFSGFIRSGQYIGQDNNDNYHFNSSFTDLSLRFETGSLSSFRAFADLRYRYGKEFDRVVNNPDLREAWAGIYSSTASLEAGKKIVKWGRADFFSKLNIVTPADDLYRSPDKTDRELANIVISGTWLPVNAFSLTALVIPLYRPSVMPFTIMDLPEYVGFSPENTIYENSKDIGIGIRNDYHFRNIDFSLYFFDGYNKYPGIKLDMLRIQDGSAAGQVAITLKEEAYRTRLAGMDIEGVTGSAGWRMEFSWLKPFDGSMQEEHIPFPELNWSAGVDISPGSLKITFEYGGKYIINWEATETDPSFPDAGVIGQLSMIPEEQAEEIVTQQVRAFNRLYNYQVERIYHSMGINITTGEGRGRWKPDISGIYNFTTGEILIMPNLLFNPFDRVTAAVGFEYWHGKKGSIYDYLSKPASAAILSLKINF